MTEHDPRDPRDDAADTDPSDVPGSRPTSDDHTRDSQTPDHDERLHRYAPRDDEERSAAAPSVGTWHREGRAASQEGAVPAGPETGWQAPSAQSEHTAPVIPPPPPSSSSSASSSSSSEHTTAFGPFTFRPDPEPDTARDTARDTERRQGRARTAGVLVGALLLGSAGGVVGAAAYTAANDDESPTGALGSPTAAVSNRTTTDRTETDSTDLPAVVGSAEDVAAKVLPSVVKINVTGTDGAGSGSGVILSKEGEILTNNHVTEVARDGGKMTVSFNDGTTAPAQLVGDDPVTDLAVIRVDGVSGLTPARIGDSEKLDVGEGVVAIGSPFGLAATVTSGIVSALNRPVSVGGDSGGDETTYPAIQTDAAINPGNSGGPLVNLAGQVVGINSSIRSSSDLGGEGGSIGLGFAIPITKVLPVVDQLRNGQTPTHARLGITVSDKGSSTDPTEDGLITGAGVEEVTDGSAGDEAGLRAGDVVTKVDDEPISSSESLVATIRGYRPGDKVTLTVLRDGKTLTLDATLDSDVESATS